MCTNLFLRNKFPYDLDYISQIEEFNKAIKKAIYRFNKKETLDLIYTFFDDLNNLHLTKNIQRLIGKSIQNIDKKILQTSLNNFITSLAPNWRIEETLYYLPCIDGGKMEWSEKKKVIIQVLLKFIMTK